MTRRAALMMLLALALAALVGWQYWPTQGTAPDRPATVAVGQAGGAGPGLNPLAGRSAAALGGWLAHPLFTPGRTPPEVAPPAAPEPAAVEVAPPAPPAPPPVPVLQGVVVTPAPGGAYLGLGETGPSQFLRPGQAALGLTLERVFADHATFMGPDGEITLPLMPAPPPQPAADAADAATAPGPNDPAPAEAGDPGQGMADPSGAGLAPQAGAASGGSGTSP